MGTQSTRTHTHTLPTKAASRTDPDSHCYLRVPLWCARHAAATQGPPGAQARTGQVQLQQKTTAAPV
jgi:hypothetical protein